MEFAELLIALAIAAVFLVPAVLWPAVGRTLLGVFFLGGALFNLLYTLPHLPTSLEGLVATAYVPFYRDVVEAAVGWRLDGALVLLVIVFEATAGLLVLWRGPLARLALLAAGAWGLGMLPVIPPEGVAIGVVLTGAPGLAGLVLLRRAYSESVWSGVTRQFRVGRAGTARAPRGATRRDHIARGSPAVSGAGGR
jgi:hypothetical protein